MAPKSLHPGSNGRIPKRRMGRPIGPATWTIVAANERKQLTLIEITQLCIKKNSHNFVLEISLVCVSTENPSSANLPSSCLRPYPHCTSVQRRHKVDQQGSAQRTRAEGGEAYQSRWRCSSS